MNPITARILTLFLVLGTGAVHAAGNVVVIPAVDASSFQTEDCPAASGTSIGGPAGLYGFCWYLGDGGESCDTVCGHLGGANLAYRAEDEWADNCNGPGPDDVSTWFFENGNPAGWDGPAAGVTLYHTLGYGYEDGDRFYYGKCSSGANQNVGSYPGDSSNDSARNVVCPCFGPVLPE